MCYPCSKIKSHIRKRSRVKASSVCSHTCVCSTHHLRGVLLWEQRWGGERVRGNRKRRIFWDSVSTPHPDAFSALSSCLHCTGPHPTRAHASPSLLRSVSAYWLVNKAGMSGVPKDVKSIFEELCVTSTEATTATISFFNAFCPSSHFDGYLKSPGSFSVNLTWQLTEIFICLSIRCYLWVFPSLLSIVSIPCNLLSIESCWNDYLFILKKIGALSDCVVWTHMENSLLFWK